MQQSIGILKQRKSWQAMMKEITSKAINENIKPMWSKNKPRFTKQNYGLRLSY